MYTGLLAGASFACMLEFSLIPTAITVAAGAFGGLLPDLDHRKSTITKKLGVLGFCSSRLFRHRGVLHAPTFYFVATAVLWLFVSESSYLQFVIYGLLVGELSHLLLDALTPKGIPMLWPFYRRHISLLPIQTDGPIDHFIGRVALIATAFILGCMVVFGI